MITRYLKTAHMDKKNKLALAYIIAYSICILITIALAIYSIRVDSISLLITALTFQGVAWAIFTIIKAYTFDKWSDENGD